MQKCNTNKSNSINFKAKEIASNLKINDRVQKLDENKSYIKIKDFTTKPTNITEDQTMNPFTLTNNQAIHRT